MALAHCISADLAMGKGIAKTFKERFGGVDELRRQSLTVGQVGILLRDGRCIFYLVTKARYFHKPARADFTAALAALAAACRDRAVARLAMPRIGCGLDGLDWPWVSSQVRAAFARHPTVHAVTVCSI
jgi:O-acetyl-ADP-ribose deacetylase (regulator of RNase III)